MHRLADGVISAERERNVADTATYPRVGQILLNPFGRPNEIDRVIVVFVDSGGDGEDVWVEDDVLWRKADFLGQNPIRASANFDFSFKGIRLAFFIKRHHDNSRTISAHQLRLMIKL